SGVEAVLAARGSAAALEVGFGTGLHFLGTACVAAAAGAAPTYVALERGPLPTAGLRELRRAEALAPCPLAGGLLDWLEVRGARPPAGTHRLAVGGARLGVLVADATEVVADLPADAFDAVYLGPFSPRANPDAWEAALLARLVAALR